MISFGFFFSHSTGFIGNYPLLFICFSLGMGPSTSQVAEGNQSEVRRLTGLPRCQGHWFLREPCHPIALNCHDLTHTSNCFTGETHHEYETDGKKCNSTSTLTVHSYGKNSTASCIIRHKGLQGRKLVAPFRFEDLGKNHQWLSLIILNLPYITLSNKMK